MEFPTEEEAIAYIEEAEGHDLEMYAPPGAIVVLLEEEDEVPSEEGL